MPSQLPVSHLGVPLVKLAPRNMMLLIAWSELHRVFFGYKVSPYLTWGCSKYGVAGWQPLCVRFLYTELPLVEAKFAFHIAWPVALDSRCMCECQVGISSQRSGLPSASIGPPFLSNTLGMWMPLSLKTNHPLFHPLFTPWSWWSYCH